MADTQPVVLSFLKLPPDQQSFFRMKDIPEMFLHKLNHLNLVLRASQESNPYPQAIELLHNLRKTAAHQCETIFGVIFYSRDFTNYWLQLIDSLSTAPLTEEALQRIHIAAWWADFTAKEVDKAHEEMVKFGQDITATAQQISTALTNGGNTARNTVLTTENAQVVTDLLSAVNECDALFLQVVRYYRELERRLQDIEFVKSNPPSEEEIEIVRQRWIGFSDSLKGSTSDFGLLRAWMLRDPRVERIGDFQDLSSSPQTAVAPLNTPNPATSGRKAIMAAAATSSVTTAQPAQEKGSFLRSLLRRLISCFSLKHFR